LTWSLLVKRILFYSVKYFYPVEGLVLFEHENKIDSAKEELYKLLYRKAPLKVIVSYLYRDSLVEKLSDYKRKFSEMIRVSNEWFSENKGTEYLFIIGHGKELDKITWYAFKIDINGNVTDLH